MRNHTGRQTRRAGAARVRIVNAVVGVGFTLFLSAAGAATVTWTGPAGNSWATGSSWNPSGGPGAGDTALFGDGASTNLPGEVTSVLNATRTVGGLTFSNTVNKYHTLDLATHTLTVTGNLNVNVDQQTTTTTIRNGSLVVSGAFANINVGRAVGGAANGTADLTGLSSLTANVQEVNVGTNSAIGATGVLKLSPSNNVTAASRVTVGSSGGDGTLNLGLSNTITTPELVVAKDHSSAVIDVASGGTFNLGTPTVRTVLRVADQNTNTNNTYQGRMTMGNAALNWNLDSLVVGQKQGGPGNAWGYVTGGGSGSVNVGTNAARGNVFVGNTITGGGTIGNVDWGGLGSLTAYVNDFYVGRAQSGAATGTVVLPATTLIDAANRVVVGEGSEGDGTLALGLNNTILAGELSVGRDNNNGTITIRNGGSLNLGSPSRRIGVMVGVGNKNSNALDTGNVNLTGGSLVAYTSDFIVGQRDGIGGGTAAGNFVAGNGGSIEIGAPGNTANFYVGRTLAGGGPASGTADFTGLATLNANVNAFAIGTSIAGSSLGNVKLAASNTINANSIQVGAGASDQLSSLQLGNVNVIQTPSLSIGQDYSSGIVTIRSGGTLTLGSPAQRTNLNISTAGSTNTNVLYTGTLDLSNATVAAYLGNVAIGNKTLAVGGQQGNLVVSNAAGNLVDATSIVLAGSVASTGNLTFAGGQMYAGSIEKGSGTANFSWSGGRLSVGTFGTASIPFNLVNAGTGTLAPGTAANAIGTTTVNGAYQQSASAALHVQIAGNSPSTGNDLLNVSGNATFAGRLNLDTINGFVPAAGQTYAIANYAARSGTFAFVDPPAMPSSAAFQLSYGATQLQVQTVAPLSKAYTSTAAAGTWSTASNWEGGAVPTTVSSVALSNQVPSPQKVTVTSPTTVHRVVMSGVGSTMELEILAGVQFGVANDLFVGAGSTLSGAGEIYGPVTVGGGTVLSNTPERLGTINFQSGTIEVPTANFSIAAGAPLGGDVDLTAGRTLRVTAGTTTVNAGASLDVAGGTFVTSKLVANGQATFDAPQALAELTVGGSGHVALAPGGADNTLVTSSLSINSAGGGKVDLGDNALVVRNGSVASLTALVKSGAHDGAWDGNGITTSRPDATAGITSIGVGNAGDLGYVAFRGVSVAAADAIAMYTYAGDANLDGLVSGDDYSAIDFAILVPGTSGWTNGDFNYDGAVTGDDFAAIDFTVLAQGAPFPTAAAGLTDEVGVVAVPEPGGVAILVLLSTFTAALCRRHRKI